MKILKFFLIFIVAIVIFYIFFGKTGPVASSISERILRQNTYILRDFDIGVDIDRCYYVGPHSLLGKVNPSLSCYTSTFFNNSSADEAIKRAVVYLQNAGWLEDKYNKYNRSKYFFKDDLLISIGPDQSGYTVYNGITADNYPLVVLLFRTTLRKPDWVGLSNFSY